MWNQISRRSRSAILESRTSPNLLARCLQKLAPLGFDAGEVGGARVTASLAFGPSPAQESKASFVGLFHDPQSFAHDLARRGVAAAFNLCLDELMQLVGQRDVHVHSRRLS